MMDRDITERLQWTADSGSTWATDYWNEVYNLLLEAKDEIERLRIKNMQSGPSFREIKQSLPQFKDEIGC